MRKYAVVEMFGDIKGVENVKAGCLIDVDENAKTLAVFDTEAEALEALNKHTHTVQNLNSCDLYRVTDYVVYIGEYDEDGEYIGTSVDYITQDWVY